MNAPLPQTTALTRWVVRGDQEAFRDKSRRSPFRTYDLFHPETRKRGVWR